MLEAALLGVGSFIFFILMHALVLNRGRFLRQAGLLAAMFAVGSAIYVLAYCLWLKSNLPLQTTAYQALSFFNGWFVYASLVGIYIGTVFYAILRSVCIRILIELKNEPGGRMTREKLGVVYSTREMVNERLQTMVETGWLDKNGEGRFVASSGGRRWARLFSFLRNRLVIGPDAE